MIINDDEYLILEFGLLDVVRVVYGYSKSIIFFIDNRNLRWFFY